MLISYYLDVEFCGDSFGCAPCPKNGVCEGKKLECLDGYVKIRYECTEVDSLIYYTQELSREAEIMLAKNAVLSGSFTMNYFGIMNELNADAISMYRLIEMVKKGQLPMIRYRKDNDQWFDVDKTLGIAAGVAIIADQLAWIGVIIGIGVWSYFLVLRKN